MNLSRSGRTLLGLPMLVMLAAFFALPLILVFVLAFQEFDTRTMISSGWTANNFVRFVADPYYFAVFGRTLSISVLVTLTSLVLAYPVAWHLNRIVSKTYRLWMTMIVLLPLMVSLVVSSFAWLLILGRNGTINSALTALGVLDEPVRLMDTVTGIVIVSVYSYISFAVLGIFASLQTINMDFVKAARVHGANEFQSFLRVVFPLSLPGVVSGGSIVFSLTMAGFVIPFLIGGGRVIVAPLMIFKFTLQLYDWAGAAALGLMLFALTLVLTWGITTIAQRWTTWER